MGLGSDLTDPGSKDELSDQIVTSTLKVHMVFLNLS
jgi:hypothetical protein